MKVHVGEGLVGWRLRRLNILGRTTISPAKPDVRPADETWARPPTPPRRGHASSWKKHGHGVPSVQQLSSETEVLNTPPCRAVPLPSVEEC